MGSLERRLEDEDIVHLLDGQGECHGCHEIRRLHACPFADEIYGDDTRTCCADCGPEHAMEI